MIFRRISSQLFFIAIAPLVFTTLAISIFFLIDSLEDAEREIEQRGKYLSEQILLLSEFHFYTGNNEEILKIAETAMKSEDMDFIRFSDNNYNAFVFLKKENYKNSKIFSVPVINSTPNLDDFVQSSSDLSSNKALGNITFGISKSKTFSKKQRIYKRILVVTLLGIVVGLFLAYLFSRRLLSGLNSLKKSASLIENKQFDQRCDENSSGELLKIQKVFNNMAESIQVNEKILQGKIHFATKSLNDTIDELSMKNRELDRTRQQAIELERSKAISDERSRIMKDMHDGIGGQLVASLALIEKEENSKIRENISEILSNCLDDFRLIINSLNTNANILSALLADFKYRMNRRLESIDIKLVWNVEEFADDIYLQPQQALHILRILQEAFSNTLKHSDASVIMFNVFESHDSINISTEDNGHFSNDTSNYGQGIKNLKWRAQQLTATIDISKTNNGGCKVLLSIPKKALLEKPST